MQKECTYCGNAFTAKRGDNRYCSKSCQSKATVERMKKIIPLYKQALEAQKVTSPSND